MLAEVKNETVASFWDFKAKDPIIDTWFLMPSPVPVLSILMVYFLIIWAGPKFMKNRPPFKLDWILMCYNAIQIYFSGRLLIEAFQLDLFADGILDAGCRYPHDTKDHLLLIGGWWYFFTKTTELLDTVFFVLRKKDRQITFLHVYHHAVMVLYTWGYVKYAAGGDGSIHLILNCAVHVVMYTYYLLAGLGPRFQKFLWWKKYVTKMQLVQFIIILAYNIQVSLSPRCNFNQFFINFISLNTTIFLILFTNFYMKTFKKEKEFKKKSAETTLEAKSTAVINSITKNENLIRRR